MRQLVFDIETDGLLADVTVIHCINVIDRTTGKAYAFNGGEYRDGSFAPHDGTIEEGLKFLEDADEIVGHNVIGYDVPAITKLFPKFNPKRVVDTLPWCRVIWTNVKDIDFGALAKGKLPEAFKKMGLIGKHSLEAWGMRLGELKDAFSPGNYTDEETGEKHTWKTIGFTREMDVYGRQDPVVTLRLLEKIESKNYSPECLEIERRVAQIIFKQEERGFGFSVDRANALVAKLQRRHAEISAEALKVFQPWYAPVLVKGSAIRKTKKARRVWNTDGLGPLKRAKKLKDGTKVTERGHYAYYDEGSDRTEVQLVVFNPSSRDHIADRLQKLRGWKPTTFTDGGKPQVDESILEALPYPEAKPLAELLLVEKRLGQVANGDKAWLKFAKRTGLYGKDCGHYRIHGRVDTNGAVTGRMTHKDPNVAQTPRVGTPYGEESRDCFVAAPGFKLVGCDAAALELCMLGHYMAKYDGGEYANAVVNGKKEDKTDVHSLNQQAIGFNSRDNGKTFIYALLYGAADYKLGTIAYDDFTDEQRARFLAKFPSKRERTAAIKRLGTAKRARLMERLPAFAKLVDAVKAGAKRGYLIGLDGRHLHVRSDHSALNTLLQGGGAVVMKKALVLFDDLVMSDRSTYGEVHYVAQVHDEAQLEAKVEKAEAVGRAYADSIRRAGECFKLRVPLSGNYAIGDSWAETH